YLRLAHDFHAIVLDRVPVMDFPQRNEAKRFIALIDTLYDNAVKLVASAAAEPMELYRATEGYEAQEFRRTASRLIEMGSRDYLALPHGGRTAVSGSTEGIVETRGCPPGGARAPPSWRGGPPQAGPTYKTAPAPPPRRPAP